MAESALSDVDIEKKHAAERALDFVESGMLLGLGTGSCAAFFVRALGERLRSGALKDVRGVPTSEATRALAASVRVPTLTFDDVAQLDLCVDGADEIDPNLHLTKGGGGALLREKVTAYASKRFITIAESKKLVPHLGAFPLPVEAIPFAAKVVARAIAALGAEPVVRLVDGRPFVSDNGNLILDCRFGKIADPPALAERLTHIPGVADHGLFIAMASLAIVGRRFGVEIIPRR